MLVWGVPWKIEIVVWGFLVWKVQGLEGSGFGGFRVWRLQGWAKARLD